MASHMRGCSVSVGRWLMLQPRRRQFSQGGALPDAKTLYRELLRAARAFPPEPMLNLNDHGSEQSFALAASLQIR
jgi:hypothetical protein